MVGDKEVGHLGFAEAHPHPKTRDPRLGHLELGLPDAVPIADAYLVIAETGDREVLAEHAGHQVVAPEVALPMVVGLCLVDHDRALFAAVTVEVTLSITVDVQP